MDDRQATKPGRVQITLDDGTVLKGYLERIDEPTNPGTPLNKNTLFNSNNSTRYAAELPSEAFEKLTTEWQIDVPTSGYSSEADEEGYFTIQFDVEGMSEQYNPRFSPLYADAASIDDIDAAFNLVKRVVTGENTVILKVTESPLTAFTLRLWGI